MRGELPTFGGCPPRKNLGCTASEGCAVQGLPKSAPVSLLWLECFGFIHELVEISDRDMTSE